MEQKFHSIRQSIPHSSPSGGNSGFRTNAGDCPDRVGVVPRALLAGYLPVAGWLNSTSGHTVLVLTERVEYILSQKLEKIQTLLAPYMSLLRSKIYWRMKLS